jgi:multiple sugar transport system ATP-binding protein
MDEPLSSLDARLRLQMRAEIKDLHGRLGATFIYVTHDQTEAMTLSDRVVVMAGGEILQMARPHDIYADPGDLRVAEFVGSPKINMLEGVIGRDGLLEVAGLRLPVDVTVAAGERVLVGIRPETPRLAEAAGKDTVAARVRLVEHLGSDVFVHVELQGAPAPLVVRLPVERASRLQSGDTLQLGLPPGQLLLFDMEGRRIRKSSSIAPLGMRALA